MADIKKKVGADQLSPEALKVVNDKKAAGKFRLKELFNLLKQVERFDETADALRAKMKKRAIIFTVLAVIFALLSLPLFILIFPELVFIACLVFAIIYWVKNSRLKKIDLNNDFRLLVMPFLDTLSEDIEPKGRIDLLLDMAGPTQNKMVKKAEIPPGRFRKVVETVFQDPWCRLDVPLVGGNRLFMDVNNTYISHDRYWRSSRGKSKHKQKWRKLVQVTAGLSPNPEVMGYDDAQTSALAEKEKLKLAEKKGVEVARLTRKFKFSGIGKAPEETINPDALVGTFFQLASMLAQPKTGSQAS